MARREARVRDSNYGDLLASKLPVRIYELIAGIYEYKGRQELYIANFSDVLDKMVEVAKI